MIPHTVTASLCPLNELTIVLLLVSQIRTRLSLPPVAKYLLSEVTATAKT